MHLKLTPGWLAFYVPVILLMAAETVRYVLALVRPQWTRLAPVARLAFSAAGSVIGFLFLRAFPYVAAAGAPSGTSYDSLAHTADGAWQTMLAIPAMASYERMAQTYNVVIFANVGCWAIWMPMAALANLVLCLLMIYRWIRARQRAALTTGMRIPGHQH